MFAGLSPIAAVSWNQRIRGESLQVFEFKCVTSKLFIY